MIHDPIRYITVSNPPVARPERKTEDEALATALAAVPFPSFSGQWTEDTVGLPCRDQPMVWQRPLASR